jgi:hypothetical protein
MIFLQSMDVKKDKLLGGLALSPDSPHLSVVAVG